MLVFGGLKVVEVYSRLLVFLVMLFFMMMVILHRLFSLRTPVIFGIMVFQGILFFFKMPFI